MKAPGFGDNRKATLQDMAIATGRLVLEIFVFGTCPRFCSASSRTESFLESAIITISKY